MTDHKLPAGCGKTGVTSGDSRLVEAPVGRTGPTGVGRGYHYTALVLTATVIGSPVTQGSINSLGKGRPSIHSNAKTLKPWRTDVKDAVRDVMATAPAGSWPLAGPVAAEISFTVRKPAGAPKRRRSYPDRRPDVDKLKRAVLDAMTAAGVYRDDGQVVEALVRKAYPNEHPDALDVPGVVIRLYTIGDQTL